RRADVVDAIVGALHVPGARVVYAEADPDHNRLDTTVLGDPASVTASAMAGAAKAIELIDMFRHRGGHPRTGPADVIPFVPVRGGIVTVSMNLIDHETTGPRAAFDAVAERAAAHGLSITDTEIVGLVPESALGPGDAEYLRLRGFDPDRQILERLVAAAEE